MSAGLYYLIKSFYRSITLGEPVPIPYREILVTAKIMDEIFAQIQAEPHDKFVASVVRHK
jgi:hypothetical protein